MNIKIQCGCGAKYSFDVEPQNGAMPFTVNCPSCNADGTEAANQLIAQSQAQAPRLRVQIASHAPSPAFAAAASPDIPLAPPKISAAEKMEKIHEEARRMRWVGRIAAIVFILLVAIVGGWIWYAMVGSKPRLAFSVKLDGMPSGWRTGVLPGGKLLLASGNHVQLRDYRADRDLWSIALPGEAPNNPRPPSIFVDPQNIWVCPGDNVFRLDEKTGEIKMKAPVVGVFDSFTPTDTGLLVVSDMGEATRIAMKINLATGETSSQTIDVPRAATYDPHSEDLPPNVAPTADVLLDQALDDKKFNRPLTAVSSEFFSTGENMVELRVKLLKPNVVWVKSIKPRGPTLINGNLTAGTSTAAVEEEVMNDIKRDKTGGVKSVDESLYEVKLRRWVNGDHPAEWTGQLTGVPSFFSLATVDLVTAGKVLIVFDKQNNELFRQQLSYPISERFGAKDMDHAIPAAEKDDVLYFFDEGVLTALSLPMGQVLWRLTSVGISQVQFDAKGMMYVDTTAGTPEDIAYSDQIKVEATPAVIMKVDPKQGKILWQVQKLGQRCFLSGKYLYTISAERGGIALANGFAEALNGGHRDVPINFNVRRLDPETGERLWHLFRDDAPQEVVFQQNWFFLRWDDKLQAFSFLDL